MLASPKNTFFFKYILNARNIKPDAVGAYVFIVLLIFPEVPHDVLTLLQLSAGCEQHKTLKRLENICILSHVCEQYFNFSGKILSFQPDTTYTFFGGTG